MWNPRYHPDKCGVDFASSTRRADDQGPTTYYVCDPEEILDISDRLEISRVAWDIATTTGCQCDNLAHCNQYESGFSLHLAVFPYSLKNYMEGASEMTNIKKAGDELIKTGTAGSLMKKTLAYGEELLSRTFGSHFHLNQSHLAVKAENLIISRATRGHLNNITSDKSDIYQLLSLYLSRFLTF